MRLLPRPNGAPAAAALYLSGTAPFRCAPSVAGVTLDGVDVGVGLASPQASCDATQPFAFNLRVDAPPGATWVVGQVYHVRVYAADTGALLAFHLLDAGANADSAPAPESGFWWSEAGADAGPASPGTGISLERQGGQLAVGLFGFTDSGAATWQFGSAALGGRALSVPLVQLANGDPMFSPTGSQPVPQNGPRLEIEFVSPTRARAYLVHVEDGRDVDVRALRLSRTPFASGPAGSAWAGQWVLVPDDGGAPRLFEFAEPSSQGAENFHLTDLGNDASLDCRLAAGSSQPDACTLSVAAATLADFDAIGLDGLSGHGRGGATVKLLRVAR
ncbi:MAG TPA: hypothetical protein VGC30_03965 [Dokdonella sp.]